MLRRLQKIISYCCKYITVLWYSHTSQIWQRHIHAVSSSTSHSRSSHPAPPSRPKGRNTRGRAPRRSSGAVGNSGRGLGVTGAHSGSRPPFTHPTCCAQVGSTTANCSAKKREEYVAKQKARKSHTRSRRSQNEVGGEEGSE